MKLYFVRHGDPDYSIDSLTEKGWREVEYLSERMVKIPAVAYFCSPMGRAKDTARPTLEKLGRTAVECEWLREFSGQIHGRIVWSRNLFAGIGFPRIGRRIRGSFPIGSGFKTRLWQREMWPGNTIGSFPVWISF